MGTDVTCPYCAETIKSGAVKCKHCGEWLDPSKRPPVPQEASPTRKPDHSRLVLFHYLVADQHRLTYFQKILAADRDSAVVEIRRSLPPGYTYDQKHGLREGVSGRFMCPHCSSMYTRAQHDFGFGMMLLIFITFGLALLLITPLVPFACECDACGYRWRT